MNLARITLGCVVSLLVAAAIPATALADIKDDKFNQGLTAMDRGDYDNACRLFQESLDAGGKVGPLVNLGDCEDHRGHLVKALRHWKEGLSEMQAGDSRIEIAKRKIEDLEHRVGRVTAVWQGAPAGATMFVDAEPLVIGGAPTLVDPGPHKVTANGGTSRTFDINVAVGELKTVDAALAPTTTPTTPPPPSSGPNGLIIGGATSLAIAGGAAIGAIISGVVYLNEKSALAHDCPLRVNCSQAAQDESSTGRAAGAANIAMFVVTGVAGGIGGILLGVGVGKSKHAEVGLVWEGTGLGVAGQF